MSHELDCSPALGPNRRVLIFRWPGLALAALITCCVGCFEPNLETQYGSVYKKTRSINSISLFAQKLKEFGFNVSVRNRISPKIENFDTVYWFPVESGCPSQKSIDALEDWLDNGFGDRTLVYVQDGYRAEQDYYRTVGDFVPPSRREELLRRISVAQLDSRKSQYDRPYRSWITIRDSCDWFDQETIPHLRSNQLSGPLAENLYADTIPTLEISKVLTPKSSALWKFESLLKVGDEELVYQLVDDSNYWKKRIIVVNNASFLVNFAMIDAGKDELADRLIEQTESDNSNGYDTPGVLILESGPDDIPIRDTDYVNQTQWAWIAEPPLCYIVPHALFWGMLFCFVYYPIFGRPKRLPEKSTTSFRSHVNAIAEQLKRNGSLSQARRAIEQYQETTSVSGGKKQ